MTNDSPKISSVNLSWKDNYVRYNDTDMTVDYFNGYILGQKATCEWLKTDGADTVRISVSNNDDKIPHLRRVKQFCKIAGYDYKDTSHMHTYLGGSTSLVIEYELRRIKPSTFIVLWTHASIGESSDFNKSQVLSEAEKDDMVKFLKECGITRMIIREFKE